MPTSLSMYRAIVVIGIVWVEGSFDSLQDLGSMRSKVPGGASASTASSMIVWDGWTLFIKPITFSGAVWACTTVTRSVEASSRCKLLPNATPKPSSPRSGFPTATKQRCLHSLSQHESFFRTSSTISQIYCPDNSV